MSSDTARPPAAVEPAAEELTVVPVRHPLRWVAVAIIALLVAMFVHSLIANPTWRWAYVRGYLTDHSVLQGIWVTIQLTVYAMVIGVVLGIVLAVMRMSPNPVLSTTAWVYTWFFRGTPVLVQVLFWYSFALLFHDVSIGLPFGPKFHSWNSNDIITPFTA